MTAPAYFPCDLSFLLVSGDKAANLLHGQFTNSIRDLAPGQGNYNLLLTVKGKVLADLHILRRERDFLLITDKNFLPLLQTHLQKLAPLSRVVITDESDRWQVTHVIGPANALPKLESGHFENVKTIAAEALVYRSDRLGEVGLDLITPKVFDLLGWLEKNTIERLNTTEAEYIRIANGVAQIGIDVTEANLPQEGRLERALHFDKGCYLGQEIIARLHFKGHVNKLLTRLRTDVTGAKPGTEILAEGKPVGVITSLASNTAGDEAVALGYVSVSHASPGTQLTADGTSFTVSN